jgi:hypothetical protein
MEETSGLFLCLGGSPHTQWAKEVDMIRDEVGYLVTGPDLTKNGHRRTTGTSTAILITWERTYQVSLRPAMCGTDPSSGAPLLWVKARWP